MREAAPPETPVPLCAGTLHVAGEGPLRTIFQVVNLQGRPHAWADAVDMVNPLLVPLDELTDVTQLGWIEEFLVMHLDAFGQLAVHQDLSSLSGALIARAVAEVEFGVPAGIAVASAWMRSCTLADCLRS